MWNTHPTTHPSSYYYDVAYLYAHQSSRRPQSISTPIYYNFIPLLLIVSVSPVELPQSILCQHCSSTNPLNPPHCNHENRLPRRRDRLFPRIIHCHCRDKQDFGSHTRNQSIHSLPYRDWNACPATRDYVFPAD